MVKIFNRGLSKKGVKEITKRFNIEFKDFDIEFKVGEIIGDKSKIMEEFDLNTNMGTVCFGKVKIPLNWLSYELVEYKAVKRNVV